jgi:hypothetical protein
MDNELEGAPEPGFFSGIRREVGNIEGEFRDVERSHKQREADKYENRAEKYEEKEREDFNKKTFLNLILIILFYLIF